MHAEGVGPNSRTQGVRHQARALGPRFWSPFRRECVRKAGEPKAGQHASAGVSEAEDKAEPCDVAFRSLCEAGTAAMHLEKLANAVLNHHTK